MIKRLPYCLLVAAAACAAPIEKPALEDPSFTTDASEDRISGGARVVADVGFPDSVTTGRFGTSRAPVGYTLTVWAPTNGVKISAKSLDGDTVLSVYGPFRTSWSAASRVGYNDDAPGLGTDSSLSLNLRSSGKYLVIVREYTSGAGSFTLTVGNPEVPARCGGLIGAQCGAGQFCDYALEDICGAADAMGTCRSIPTVCTRDFRPVCGCDDKTYSNPCSAHAAGVAVAKAGECVPALDCSAPNACGPERHYSPRVCEDGSVIYGRASCVLDGDSCQWRYDAPECPTPARCGGFAGLVCPANENVYCHYATTQNCGRFDQLGTCRSKPTVCTREFRPVCGCDGRTYSNACNAAASGTSIVASGSCSG